MIGNEWLNLIDGFAVFIGPWIMAYMGVAVFGSLGATLIGFFWRRVPIVRIVGRNSDEA